MSFSFFTWLHNEVVALRAAVARLEAHAGVPESKPAEKPADAVPPAAQPPAPAPAPAPVAPAAPSVTDLLFGGGPAAAGPAAAPAAGPGWSPSPTMTYADCTGQNIPLNLGTTYTITDCPAATTVGTNITTLPCDPYVLTVNGVGTPHPVQTGQCTVYAAGPTVVVSVAPLTPPGVVNLILQVHG